MTMRTCRRPTPMNVLLAALLLAPGGAVVALPVVAQESPVPTRVRVRAVADDAKVIGSGVGGARITIRNLETGEVLASGVQEGTTGSTRRIMQAPRERGSVVFDTEGTAHYTAELGLDRPTRVEIVAEGPLATPHAGQRAGRTLLLVPGHHVLGEGVVLVLSGFTVELLEPGPGGTFPAGGAIPVEARVTMLCGCPTEPGGLWDADRIEIAARLVRAGRVLTEMPLSFTGRTSEYEGRLELPPDAGPVELQVVAVDRDTPNAGIVRREIDVSH